MKIIMATMGLGLGGAETHIVELSKELRAEGHTVLVVSNGGDYVPEIEAAGVRHVHAPMHTRNPLSMAKSFFILLGLVKKERPDVIHAHARIPAFISHFVGKLTGTAFVTTDHGWFKTSSALVFLTRWGEKVLAVSEDIKGYLMQEYGVDQSDITVTVNGIDTERFKPRTDVLDIKKELGIKDEKIILSVCRMEYSACKSAFLLLDMSKKLYEYNPYTKIILVGGGDALTEIRERAAAINQDIGAEYVLVLGGRTDVYKFVSMADIFVGVSRAALEAMSCETPVILAGNAGYLGLYEKKKLADCISTNFTCRDFAYPEEKVIFEDVVKGLALSEAQRAETGERELIVNNYSVVRMAEDAISVYKKVARKKNAAIPKKHSSGLKKQKNDFLLAGYYGFENAGDEALLKTIVDNLHRKKPGAKICVLVKRGVTYDGIEVACTNRFGIFEVLRAMRCSRVLIFGGGNLIQDATSTASALYYLMLLKTAKILGLKTMLYGNGVGPLKKKFNRHIAKNVLETVDIITVREELSRKILEELGVTKPKIVLTADEIFSVAGKKSEGEKKYLTISLRSWEKMDEHFVEKIVLVAEYICKEFELTARLLPLMEGQDLELSKRVYERLTCRKELAGPKNYIEIMENIAESRFVIGMRLHALIFAVSQNVLFYGVSYDKKIDAFGAYAHAKESMPCASIDAEKMKKSIEGMLRNEKENLIALEKRRCELQALAEKNADFAINLLS